MVSADGLFGDYALRRQTADHELGSAEARVTDVQKVVRIRGGCSIFVRAAFRPPGWTADVDVRGPRDRIDRWLNGISSEPWLRAGGCGQVNPEVGDTVPVQYALDDPLINRPEWIDLDGRIRRGTVALAVSGAIGVALLLVSYRRAG